MILNHFFEPIEKGEEMKRRLILGSVLALLVILAIGCGPRQTIVGNLGNAENSLFAPDGRLFISGAQIWEIKQTERGHKAVSLTEEFEGQFAGLALYQEHIFAVCAADENMDAWLMRAELTDTPRFEKIFQLTGFTMANGMEVDANGHLYIADETIINKKGKIVRLSLTDDPVPQVVESSQIVWLAGDEGAPSPNDMVIIDDTLFFSNFESSGSGGILTSIKRTTIAGDDHGPVETVFKRKALKNSSFIDDFTSVEIQGRTYLIAADYLKGTILTVDAQDTDQTTPLYETNEDKFAGPTSCIVGQGLGFDGEDLLVTEGGIVTIDPNSGFGNRLSTVRFQAPN